MKDQNPLEKCGVVRRVVAVGIPHDGDGALPNRERTDSAPSTVAKAAPTGLVLGRRQRGNRMSIRAVRPGQ